MRTKIANTFSLDPRLFWDYKLETFDIEKHDVFIITRYLRYGSPSQQEEMISFYTKPIFLERIKEATNLNKEIVDGLAAKYKLRKRDFACWKKVRSGRDYSNF